MITLKNLYKATKQQVFDQVAEHLLTQQAKSVEGALCLYRNPDGLKCAAGCLIGDDEYDKISEDSWQMLVENAMVPPDHAELIMELQDLHDHEPVKSWKSCLLKTARWRGLSTEKIHLL